MNLESALASGIRTRTRTYTYSILSPSLSDALSNGIDGKLLSSMREHASRSAWDAIGLRLCGHLRYQITDHDNHGQ